MYKICKKAEEDRYDYFKKNVQKRKVLFGLKQVLGTESCKEKYFRAKKGRKLTFFCHVCCQEN